jgi:hypothetical protein
VAAKTTYNISDDESNETEESEEEASFGYDDSE